MSHPQLLSRINLLKIEFKNSYDIYRIQRPSAPKARMSPRFNTFYEPYYNITAYTVFMGCKFD